HALPAAIHSGWAKRMKARGYSLILTPFDPEVVVAKGGVGVMAPIDYRVTEMPARTSGLAKARALGRVMRVVLRTGHQVAITVYNVYGFPGGHQEKAKAGRTNALLEAVVQDIVERGDTYVAIWGSSMRSWRTWIRLAP
ncbi:MAG: hypothetical protein ACKPKO_57255, partial [Candidatus Fonsibacter sp.]